MNNIYDNPEYVNIKDMMHERLVDLRNKYGDSDELNEMHLERYLASRKRVVVQRLINLNNQVL